MESFVKYLKALLLEDDHNNNPYINRALKFCVQFCMSLDKNNKNEDITHPLMVEVFNKILKVNLLKSNYFNYAKYSGLIIICFSYIKSQWPATELANLSTCYSKKWVTMNLILTRTFVTK